MCFHEPVLLGSVHSPRQGSPRLAIAIRISVTCDGDGKPSAVSGTSALPSSSFMAEDEQSPQAGASLRRAFTSDDSAQLRNRRASSNRFSTPDAPAPGVRRRSSNLSDYSLSEARKTFQSSTDDLLLPKPSAAGHESSQNSSAWHSAPLAFALLPAIGGMLFKNGSSVITDIMLLGLAAIFLNWSVRLPWSVSRLPRAICLFF